uniref:Uncharacterized protein n=1 Tax=Athene cunicularia TaxID=194338 RepID=A0A663MN15_ATHCN
VDTSLLDTEHENAALIKCKCSELRFTHNCSFLLLSLTFWGAVATSSSCRQLLHGDGGRWGAAEGESPLQSPLHAMALGLLANHPESAPGHLVISSSLDRNLDIILLDRNWLGTGRLPLTENISEIEELCAYFNQRDTAYKPMKDALQIVIFLFVTPSLDADWTAEVFVCSLYQTTLLKCPELLSNDKKVCWITCCQTLLIYGDGQMFWHIFNFLRLGKFIFLFAVYKEWPPFGQEALYHSDAYSNTKDLKGKQETSGVKYSEMILQVKGIKRRNPLGGYDTCSDRLVNSSFYKHLGSPSRKRGMRSSLTEKVESKDSASHIQKLISLVKGWDTVSSKRCDFQHVRTSDSSIPGSVSQCNTPEKDRGVRAPVASAPGKISFTIQGNDHIIQCEVGAEGERLEKYVFTQSLPVTPRAGTHQCKGCDLPCTTATMGSVAGLHRIIGKAKCINNNCGWFCYYSSASQVIIFLGKNPLSHSMKESWTELCLGSSKQYVMVTLSEFSM